MEKNITEKNITVITRRKFIKWGGLALGGAMTSGVCSNIWDYLLDGRDLAYAYPSKYLSIEEYTKGKVKVGQEITASNVESVKDLLAPGSYELIKKYGKKVKIVETTTDPYKLVYKPYMEASERNNGLAIIDKKKQLWAKEPDKPWIGGTPFLKPKDGLECMWNHALLQIFFYDDVQWTSSPDYILKVKFDEKGQPYGKIRETQDNRFFNVKTIGRTKLDPKPYIPEFKDELYRTTVVWVKPFDLKDLKLLIIMPYRGDILNDQYIYIPALRRVRRASTAERFEAPDGGPLYVSDYNTHNDPIITWTYKLIAKRPMLAPLESLIPDRKSDEIAPYSFYQLRPEVYVVEAIPTGYPRAPYSRKLLYQDSVGLYTWGADFYDRAGKLWKHVEIDVDSTLYKDKDGNPEPDRSCFYTIDFLRGDASWKNINKPGYGKHNVGLKVADFFIPKALLRLKY